MVDVGGSSTARLTSAAPDGRGGALVTYISDEGFGTGTGSLDTFDGNGTQELGLRVDSTGRVRPLRH